MHWLAPLFLDSPGAKPEHRFFLILFLYKFGVDNDIKIGVLELSEKLELNDRTISGALNYWVEQGLIIRSKMPSGGRPASSYRCSEVLREWVNKCHLSNDSSHLELLRKLLTSRGGSFWAELKVPSQFLYMALLARSNEFGLVSRVGKAYLVRLSGMSESRVSRHLRLLIKTGLLCCLVSGFSSTELYGKVHSIYLVKAVNGLLKPAQINFASITLDSSEMAKSFFALAANLQSNSEVANLNGSFKSTVRSYQLEGIVQDSFVEIVPLLSASSNRAAEEYMQFKMEEYAISLINNWGGHESYLELSDALFLEKIQKDTFNDKIMAVIGNSTAAILIAHIYRAAAVIAAGLVSNSMVKERPKLFKLIRLATNRSSSSRILFYWN